MEPRSGQSHCLNATRALVRGFPAGHSHLTRPLSLCPGSHVAQPVPTPRAQGFFPAPVISSRPQGGLGFSKDPSHMPQNEPNFRVGLKPDSVPLGGPRIDPEVQNHCHLWLPRTGCVSAMDEPNSQSPCCHQQLVPLWALLSKDPATDCTRPPDQHCRA